MPKQFCYWIKTQKSQVHFRPSSTDVRQRRTTHIPYSLATHATPPPHTSHMRHGASPTANDAYAYIALFFDWEQPAAGSRHVVCPTAEFTENAFLLDMRAPCKPAQHQSDGLVKADISSREGGTLSLPPSPANRSPTLPYDHAPFTFFSSGSRGTLFYTASSRGTLSFPNVYRFFFDLRADNGFCWSWFWWPQADGVGAIGKAEA